MSYLDTKQALISKLLSTSITGITSADIQYENSDFNPIGKDKYIGCYFIPATSDTTGKEAGAPQEQRGIFQITIYIKANSGNYSNDQLQIVDDILAGFAYNSSAEYNGRTVRILESSVNSGANNGAWYKRDVSIDYLIII